MRAVFHEVFCDAGDQVVGGGFAAFDAISELLTSGPDGDGDQSWFVAWLGTDTVDVRVLCADFGTPHQQPAGVAATVTDPEGRTLEPSAPVVAQKMRKDDAAIGRGPKPRPPAKKEIVG